MLPLLLPGGRLSQSFPPLSAALDEPQGLLAAEGCLSCERLVDAYRQGIFPWFDDSQPILWWSPTPRAVLMPHSLHISRSLRKAAKRSTLCIKLNHNFEQVIEACAAPRDDQEGTWITEDMIEAYCELHRQGFAQSIEVYDDEQLVGGLYGVKVGQLFFGESMFSRIANGSKYALAFLALNAKRLGIEAIDCQMETEHLTSMGTALIDRESFIGLLDAHTQPAVATTDWHGEYSVECVFG